MMTWAKILTAKRGETVAVKTMTIIFRFYPSIVDGEGRIKWQCQ